MANIAAVMMSNSLDGATWRGMSELVRRDFARTVEECTRGAPLGRLRRLGHLIVPSAFCAIIFRIAHLLHANGWWRLGAMIALLNQRICGVMLHPASEIGPGLFIPHPVGVTFCGRAGTNLSIYPIGYIAPAVFPGWRNHIQPDWPRLGDNVRIVTAATVIGNVSVGNNALIGVHVVLRSDIDDSMVVLVRPNWRLNRKGDVVVPDAAEHVGAGALNSGHPVC
jgi:serine O-acetyltransferase